MQTKTACELAASTIGEQNNFDENGPQHSFATKTKNNYGRAADSAKQHYRPAVPSTAFSLVPPLAKKPIQQLRRKSETISGTEAPPPAALGNGCQVNSVYSIISILFLLFKGEVTSFFIIVNLVKYARVFFSEKRKRNHSLR